MNYYPYLTTNKSYPQLIPTYCNITDSIVYTTPAPANNPNPGLVKHEELDDRAFDALKEFECEGACAVLQQFKDSNLSHVQNKSAFLCGVMKTYRQVRFSSLTTLISNLICSL